MWFLSLTPCLGWSARCSLTKLLSKVEWNRKLVCRARRRDASGTLEMTLASCGVKLHWGSAGPWMQNKRAWRVQKFGISFWQLAAVYVIFVLTKTPWVPPYARLFLEACCSKSVQKKHTIFIYDKSLGSVCVLNMYYFIDVVAYWSILNHFMTWDSWLFPAQTCSSEMISKLSWLGGVHHVSTLFNKPVSQKRTGWDATCDRSVWK